MTNLLRKITLALLFAVVQLQAVNLAWDANTETNIVGYKVYYGTAVTAPQGSHQVATTTASLDLSPGSYVIWVTAINSDGLESDPSTTVTFTQPAAVILPDTIAPSVPVLTAVAVSSSQINLSWTASTDAGGSGFRAYQVYRGGTLLTTVLGTTYANTGLTPGTYCYTVLAYDNAGNNSAQSVSRCVTIGGTRPIPPRNVRFVQ